MAQALISNLNTIQETAVNLQDKIQKTDEMDFGKIFDSKTNNSQNKTDLISTNNFNKTSANSNPITENDTTQQNNLTKTSYNSNSQTDCNITTDKPITTDSDTDLNSELVSMALTDMQNINAEEAENLENIIAEEEAYIIEETITQDTIITEEEPTMYKELTTLENPTTALLLQSQIQKTVTQNLENEQPETPNENTALKTTNQNLNSNDNSTAVFKQFENVKNASVVNLTPKENTHSGTESSKSSNIINENIVKELNVEVVNAQSAEPESTMSDLMQNQSPQDHTARIMIQGDVKFESLVQQETAKTATQIKTTDITPSKIIEQISKQLDGMFNNSKLDMVLNPGTLGKVNLQLVNSKAGLMAQFTVTTQDAKELLLKGLDGLKESLLAQGVNVDNVTVKLEEAESEYKFNWTEQEGSKGGYKHQGEKKQKDEGKNFEQMMFDKEKEVNV